MGKREEGYFRYIGEKRAGKVVSVLLSIDDIWTDKDELREMRKLAVIQSFHILTNCRGIIHKAVLNPFTVRQVRINKNIMRLLKSYSEMDFMSSEQYVKARLDISNKLQVFVLAPWRYQVIASLYIWV